MKKKPKDPEKLGWGWPWHHPIDGDKLVTGRLVRKVGQAARALGDEPLVWDAVWKYAHPLGWWGVSRDEQLCKVVHLPTQ